MPRNALLDNVKGLLIFLVVFTHFFLPYVVGGEAGVPIDTLFYFVFCFHMPFFVFISGYFSKNTQKARKPVTRRVITRTGSRWRSTGPTPGLRRSKTPGSIW